MKSLTKKLVLNITERMEFVNITPQVEDAVQEAGVQEGLCLVNAMHITASVFINDDEPGLHHDYKTLARGARSVRPLARALPPQPHRRGQRRRPPQAADHGPRGGRGDHRRAGSTSAPGSRSSTASSTDAVEAGDDQDHWGMRTSRIRANSRRSRDPRSRRTTRIITQGGSFAGRGIAQDNLSPMTRVTGTSSFIAKDTVHPNDDEHHAGHGVAGDRLGQNHPAQAARRSPD